MVTVDHQKIHLFSSDCYVLSIIKLRDSQEKLKKEISHKRLFDLSVIRLGPVIFWILVVGFSH